MEWKTLHEKSEWLFKKITRQTEESPHDGILEQLAQKMQDSKYIEERIRRQQHFDYLKAYKKLLQPKRRLPITLFKIAAAIILLIGTITIFYLSRTPSPEMYYGDLSVTAIKPGERKAFLIKHNGEEIELGQDMGIINETNGTHIRIDSNGLNYTQIPETTTREVIYNTLIVPRGGEYHLTLSDGTKIWLNADSELRYPINFTGNTREVIIVGEAYFEVKKQAGKPFIVRTGLGNITVLGTQFNVSNYPEKEQLITTLVTGKVSCSLPDGRNMILSPDQQLTVNQNGATEIKNVKTCQVTSWKDGMFLFEDMRLEDILEQLTRWYDIHVFYTNESVKDLHFSGDLSRFKNIDTFIEMFEKSSDVKLTLKGKTLIVGL